MGPGFLTVLWAAKVGDAEKLKFFLVVRTWSFKGRTGGLLSSMVRGELDVRNRSVSSRRYG